MVQQSDLPATAIMLYALLLAIMAAPAGAQERCTQTPTARTCVSEVGPVGIRTVAEQPGGDMVEAEVFVPAKYAESPGFARAVGGVTLQVTSQRVTERTDLFARLMEARHNRRSRGCGSAATTARHRTRRCRPGGGDADAAAVAKRSQTSSRTSG